jgi:hypothetical protein
VNEPFLLRHVQNQLMDFLRAQSIVLDMKTCHQSLGMRAPHVIVIGFQPKDFKVPELEDETMDENSRHPALDAEIAIQNLTMVANSRPRFTLYFIVHSFPEFGRFLDLGSGSPLPLCPGEFLSKLFPPDNSLVKCFGVEAFKYRNNSLGVGHLDAGPSSAGGASPSSTPPSPR